MYLFYPVLLLPLPKNLRTSSSIINQRTPLVNSLCSLNPLSKI